MKKYLALILVLAIMSLSSGAFAEYTDIPAGASYSAAIERATALGIMDGVGSSTFKPNDFTTREQFSKMIVIAAGLGNIAATLKGPTVFSDVVSDGDLNGYINEALSKGFITGMVDGKFHPNYGITYAQTYTAMIKALGYTEQDVPGAWPKNYMEKAKALGLSDGVTPVSSAQVPRWAMAVMLDNLLDINIKKASPAEAAKTLAQASGLTSETMYTVYSKPEVARNFISTTFQLGDIVFRPLPSFVKNTVDNGTVPATLKTGESITIRQIKDLDVVYQVSDVTMSKKYILVIDNKVTGKITGILPNKFAPNTVQLGGKDYQLGQYFNMSRLNSTTGSFRIDDSVTLLLGYDGKVVDMVSAVGGDNSSFAFVTGYTSNKSTDAANAGKNLYTVKLLHIDGSTMTYKIVTDPSSFKGTLVKYIQKDAQTVELESLSYIGTDNDASTTVKTDLSLKQYNIKKDDRQIVDTSNGNYNYAADNIKIFNLVTNDGVTATVQLLNWSDLPSGFTKTGKVAYMNKTGAFSDVNIMLLNDIFEQYLVMGMVESVEQVTTKGITKYNYNIMVGQQKYVHSVSSPLIDIARGSVLRLKIVNGSLNSITEYMIADTNKSLVQAVDSNRIKVNDTIYRFKENLNIYLLGADGSVSVIGYDDIKTNQIYSNVAVYVDKSFTYGGRVEVIVLKGL